MKPEIVDLPYPSLDNIGLDPQSAMIISPAYAGRKSELNAILQYIYDSFQFKYQGYEQYAKLMESIAVAEMKHLDLLGSMLIRLGVDPVYSYYPPIRNNFYSTGNINYVTNPIKMLERNLAGEEVAIDEYNEILSRLNNQNVAVVISRIIKDEELHVKLLTQAIKDFQRNN